MSAWWPPEKKFPIGRKFFFLSQTHTRVPMDVMGYSSDDDSGGSGVESDVSDSDIAFKRKVELHQLNARAARKRYPRHQLGLSKLGSWWPIRVIPNVTGRRSSTKAPVVRVYVLDGTPDGKYWWLEEKTMRAPFHEGDVAGGGY